ncbi:MAG: hypothetical protein ACLPTJ_07580 [Solirubrobacteraceae bacterium]
MTSAQLEFPTRLAERRGAGHGDRAAVPASRRRTGMVSEAVVARYIRDLAGHGRRAHGATERRQVVTR